MLKKRLALLSLVLLPALLAACGPLYLDSSIIPATFGSVTVVGDDIPNDFGTKPTIVSAQGKRNPIIQSLTANPTTQVPQGQAITFQVVASDINQDILQYNWSATGGTLSTNTGQVVSWNPPTKAGVYTVTVSIQNGTGGFTTGSLNLTVQGDGDTSIGTRPIPASIPPGAVVTPLPTALPASPPVVLLPSVTPAPTPTPFAPTPTPSAAATSVPVPYATGSVSGLVKAVGGTLLAGADVQLKSADPTINFDAHVTADANGRYTFASVPANVKVLLVARATGYANQSYAFQALQNVQNSFSFDGTYALVKGTSTP